MANSSAVLADPPIHNVRQCMTRIEHFLLGL